MKDVEKEYETCIGVREESIAPGSLADMFGVETVLDGEEVAWKEMWKGMPEYSTKERPEKTLTINFASEQHFNEFIEKFEFKNIGNKTKTVWWPELPKSDNYLTRFIDEE